MTRAEIITKQRAIGLPESWKPQFIVAILPRHFAGICEMWQELPGPGAGELEIAEANEFIRTAIHCGASGFYRRGPETAEERQLHIVERGQR